MNPTRRLVYTAMFISAGMCLPQFFHLIAGAAAGAVFLPMHIPVIIAGAVLGAGYGVVTGISLPLLSMLITGMPDTARMPFMTIELGAYGAVSGFTKNLAPALWLLITMAAGRLAYLAALAFAFYILSADLNPLDVFWTALATGLIGTVIQAVIMPPLAVYLRRICRIEKRRQPA